VENASSSSDAALLGRARAGDAEAFGLLVERHQDYIYNAVYHLVGSDHEAEDIAQQVFVLAYGNLGRFRGQAKFSTWLYGIMLNTVRTYWRRQKGRATLSLDDAADDEQHAASLDPPDDGPGPPEVSTRREQVQAVREAIASLDEELREIVVLRDIRGLSYDELAESLGLPAGTVKSRLHRARRMLKDKLEPLYGETL
jgi:RNA polymerase sigma-70 factor (ECF subfamily)